jgi:ribosomal protein S11
MKKVRHANRKDIKKNIKKHSKNKLRVKQKSFMFIEKRWIAAKKTFSPTPYIITISLHKRNIFYILSNIRGQTKMWTSSGRFLFKGRDKTTYMALLQVTNRFLKMIWRFGIRNILLKLKNLKRGKRHAVWKSLKKSKKIYPFHFVGFFFQREIAFNGGRKKKKRRK